MIRLCVFFMLAVVVLDLVLALVFSLCWSELCLLVCVLCCWLMACVCRGWLHACWLSLVGCHGVGSSCDGCPCVVC